MSFFTRTKQPGNSKAEAKRKDVRKQNDKSNIPSESSVDRITQQIMQSFYHVSYLAGAFCVRFGKRVLRRLQAAAKAVKGFGLSIKAKVHKLLVRLQRRAMEPIRRYRVFYAAYQEKLCMARLQNSKEELSRVQRQYLRKIASYAWRATKSVCNVVFPVAAICVLVLTVNHYSNLTFALAVEYNDTQLGYISDETVFEEAQKEVKSRIVYDNYEQPEDAVARFTLSIVDEDQLSDSTEMTNKIIQASGNEITEAYGLYIDDTFYGAATDKDQLLSTLTAMLDSYSTGDPTEEIEFIQPVRVEKGLYPVSSVTNLAQIESDITKEEQQQQTYTVQAGDAPTSIADKVEVPYATIKALNPDIENSLFAGQEILISKAVPVLGVKVIKEETYSEEIPFDIVSTENSSYPTTYKKVTQTGEVGEKEVTAKVTYVDGVEESREIVQTVVVTEPVDQEQVVGTAKPSSGSVSSSTVSGSTGSTTFDGTFIWPVDGGGYVSCALYGYWGHTGMDIAGRPVGTPIRAVAAGVVEVASYRTDYGRYIVINHGNGLKTLYAHNSALYVSVGQTVSQGQQIAALGGTGNVTGPHLHIEFRLNGQVMNPASYIGSR